MAERYGTWFTPYAAVLGSRIRSQRTYRLSFVSEVLTSLLVGVVEFAEVWVIFHNVRTLGGLDVRGALLLFGLSNTGFALAQVLFGHLDGLSTMVRRGTLDSYYLRPQPLLAQLITSDIELRRFARAAVAIAILGLGLARNDIHWDTTTFALLAVSLLGSIVLFAGIFVCAAGLQFFLIEGSEITNSFTYGGSFAATQPTSVFPTPLQLVFGFAIPVAFTGYLPTIALLGIPGPALLPSWLVWCTPIAALWAWLVAALLWRIGVRHYQSGGG
ncbi:ABC transporter permease [Nocardia panacis]|uniref:ABC transporter permease n=1 Tax=Nocardia panacis TaxID=2340916 RepID=A0A3A4KL44_9NOCA|nr:ABC-2 family transporter protein [Nocardia panacis]RJO77582.1 ABC transporter permease [Nocardia panacis]